METKATQRRRIDHVIDSEVGNLVAYEFPNGRLKSAKIVRKSTEDQVLKLETAYGATLIVPFSDVVWIKEAGELWPSEVHQRLKFGT